MDRCKVLINEFPEKGYSVVFISGILNLFTAKSIRTDLEPLLLKKRVRVIVDLEEMQSIDSSGIGALVNLILSMRKHEDARIVFTQPTAIVMHIFEVTKLKSFFNIIDDYEMAQIFFND
jgi:anti-sigma B factor antagonist